MSSDFYTSSILPYAAIIIKICRAYTNSQEDYEDYYQEVCLQIWKSKDNFSTAIRMVYLDIQNIIECMSDFIKKGKNSAEHFSSDALPDEAVEDSHAFADESLNMLYDAIKHLTEVDRAVILLYLEEKSYQEIAEIIGTNPNNIGVRIKRIKERLKKLLHGKVN